MSPRALLTLMVAAAAYAQGPVADAQRAEQLRLAERALQRVTVEVERLVDMRMRHDLGLIAELDEDVVRVEGETGTREMDRMRGVLAELMARNAVLAGEHDAARRLYAERRAAAGAAPQRAGAGDYLSVPAVGARVSAPFVSDLAADAATQAAPAPAGEVRPTPVEPEDLGRLSLDPIRAQIHGSDDPLCVARSLYKAGQALTDRAAALRRHGQAAAAAAFDERARERLERALDELRPLSERPDAPFAAWFYESRCLELLFRCDERYPDESGKRLSLAEQPQAFQQRAQAVRDPLLRILSARERSEIDPDGAWQQAAKTAMEHFRWVNIHAGYDATARIEAVTWPGEERR